MTTDRNSTLRDIRSFPSLIRYLRDEMDWPISTTDFEDLTFDYSPEELGIDVRNAAKIQEIRRLRPLSTDQPWGIFFVKFEPKRLPVVALRRILSQVTLRKRASSNSTERQAWETSDLLFISNYGEDQERRISLANFSAAPDDRNLPTLRVLGWDNLDTPLHLDAVARDLTEKLSWPKDESDAHAWRQSWRSAFTLEHREVITTSRELSLRLASLALSIRHRIGAVLSIESPNGPLTKLLRAFQELLLHDLDEAGFADMYAQTIAYGLLSTRVTDPASKSADELPAQMRTNPFLKDLMETFLLMGGRGQKKGNRNLDFDELGISEIIELLDNSNMEAVVRDFGDRNPSEDPVIHFYEDFLSAYDNTIRFDRGVFYTPRPVVSYIVRSVDELLKTEFDLQYGLADTTTWAEMIVRFEHMELPEGVSMGAPFVQILDPATGTGTFLVEAIDVIHGTMVEKWLGEGRIALEIPDLWDEYVAEHLLPRLHAYELLMAPYAIAHMKIGLKLYETGYKFESDQRAQIYLTNALEPVAKVQYRMDSLPALALEAHAVNEVKSNTHFTVIIGNPPYAGHSSNNGDWIKKLLVDFYRVDGKPLGEKNTKWLQDDYVKFLRFSQYQMDRSGIGIVGLITNHGYLKNPTFRGVRKSLMDTFAKFMVLDLHGNTKKKELAEDGTADKNVFDIQQGVAIALGVRTSSDQEILQGDVLGTRESKYSDLLKNSLVDFQMNQIHPTSKFYLFAPAHDATVDEEYNEYWPINEAMPVHSLGVVTARDALCIQWTPESIGQLVEDFASRKPEDAREKYDLGRDARDWKVTLAQEDLRQSGLSKNNLVPILYRPFDKRWTYYTGRSRGFHCMPRGAVMRHMLETGNVGIAMTRNIEIGDFTHIFATTTIAGHHCVSLKEVNYVFPLHLASEESELLISDRINFSQLFRSSFPPDSDPREILGYIYSILHSPSYRERHSEMLKLDFPRVPVTTNNALFSELAEIGNNLIGYHTWTSAASEPIEDRYFGPIAPEIGRVGWSDGVIWLDARTTIAKSGHRATQPGETGFRGVSEELWDFKIGGYQVCHKWLADRKGRVLSPEDLMEYQQILTALEKTIFQMSEIDLVIDKHGAWPGAFGSS